MKGALTLSALIAVATATSDAVTIRSTSISSTCSSSLPVLPSSALSGGYYGNSSIPASAAAPATTSSKSKHISYAYETAYATDAVDITRTVCDASGHCSVTTDIGKLTTYTTTIDGILTVITTGVPTDSTEASTTTEESSTPLYTSNAGVGAAETTTTVPSATAVDPAESKKAPVSESSSAAVTSAAPADPVTQYLTTLVTITSCSENRCSEVPKTTGVKIISAVDTVYTTYCPLTESTSSTAATSSPSSEAPHSEAPHSEAPHSEAPHSEAPKPETPPQTSTQAPVVTSEAPKPKPSSSSTKSKSQATVNVITDNIITETPSAPQQQATSKETVAAQSSSSTTESPSINTYEGAAMSMKATGLVTVAISVLMMMI
ncbi:hypothetical protein I9W82_003420 [Candida metapsilosis]|uniref:Uncharacterized protein n=1 Tax=Candida metapsilosis TaxID=273372 RepID=A0A8H8DAZ1_9ASCO|nr:hypothetical protein I9W82_003420 [Candida metapsilosis]